MILVAAAPAAHAANTRVAISGYRWNKPEIHLNAGEHVTWYWIGPDLMHSVTGQLPNARGLDSDPQTNQPLHDLGSTFQVTFSQPGIYDFECKLHNSVRGEIIVSGVPGDPTSEPDPVPKTLVDLTGPRVSDVRLSKASVRRKRGIATRYSLDENARVSADLYRFRPERGKKAKVFAGYQVWDGHIGFNTVDLGEPGKHFKARPGRYMAIFRATDDAANESKVKRVRFTINPA